MSNRERRRCRIGGTLSAICCVICLIIGIPADVSGLLVSGAIMAVISASYWIKLAANPVSTKKPSKAEAAVAAEAFQERAKSERLQRESIQQTREAAYLKNPVPLQIRRWTFQHGWGEEGYRKDLDAPLYIYSFGRGLALSSQSMDSRNRAVIYPQNGVWYVKPMSFGTMFSINDADARSKCPGMPVNTQEIRIMDPCVLLPGDCLKVTELSSVTPGVPGSADTYFRIEEKAVR